MAVCPKYIAPVKGVSPQCAVSAPASAPTPCAPVRPQSCAPVRLPVRPPVLHDQCAHPVRPIVFSLLLLSLWTDSALKGTSCDPVRPPVRPEVWKALGALAIKAIKIKDHDEVQTLWNLGQLRHISLDTLMIHACCIISHRPTLVHWLFVFVTTMNSSMAVP